jgi:phosphoribosylanthranilate isomerase
MTAVKICGIAHWEDACAACDCGADALGFIFFEGSPRYIKPDAAREIIARLPRTVAKVGVFVNQPLARVRGIFKHCRLDFIQLSGDEPPEFCNQIPDSIVFKAVSPKTEGDLNRLMDYRVRAFVVDSRDADRYGGTGNLANWEQGAALGKKCPIILAGGLNPDNVEAAIAAVSPRGVDVSTGVEIRPGKKDPPKMRRFVEKARSLGSMGHADIFDCHRIDPNDP